jgi:hypothetical protein
VTQITPENRELSYRGAIPISGESDAIIQKPAAKRPQHPLAGNGGHQRLRKQVEQAESANRRHEQAYNDGNVVGIMRITHLMAC